MISYDKYNLFSYDALNSLTIIQFFFLPESEIFMGGDRLLFLLVSLGTFAEKVLQVTVPWMDIENLE